LNRNIQPPPRPVERAGGVELALEVDAADASAQLDPLRPD
jgi:hypothetical protein